MSLFERVSFDEDEDEKEVKDGGMKLEDFESIDFENLEKKKTEAKESLEKEKGENEKEENRQKFVHILILGSQKEEKKRTI